MVSDMDLGLERYLTLVVHTLRHGGEATRGPDLKDIGGYEIIGAKTNIYTRNILNGGVTCWNHGDSPYSVGKTTPLGVRGPEQYGLRKPTATNGP